MRRILVVLVIACLLAGCIRQPLKSPPGSEPLQSPESSQVTQPQELQEMEESEELEAEDTTLELEDTIESEDRIESENIPATEWKTSTPEEQALDPDSLSEIYNYIEKDGRINSFLIVKNGYLVVEEYYNEYDENSQHNIYSCTKSIMSALIGIAVDNGHIKSVDEKVLDFFPEYEFKYTDERKKEVTIEHLLTMTSGLKFGELQIPYTSEGNPFIQMINSEDWIQFVLDKPVIHTPGTTFDYSSGSSHVLSAILQKATGTDSLSYAVNYLFGPLGISEADIFWEIDPQGIYVGGSWLHMRPRDMAKFGLLYLNKGKWNGNQIIPRKWVEKSTRSLVHVEDYADYGYQWWVESNTMYFAEGYRGQFICVLKDLNVVVVLTADVPESDVSEVFSDLIAYIRAAGNQSRYGYLVK